MQKHWIYKFAAFALLAVCCVMGRAQTITGSVNGTVTDPSGAVIPNAKVTATNVATGVTTPTTTNNDGVYNIRFLQIGTYKVTIDAPGFATANYGPFTLETGQNAKVDGKLVLAGQQQSVSVNTEIAPLLNTENPTLATTLDTRAIENAPSVGRNIVALTMFLPGAISTSPNGFTGNNAIANQISSNTVSVNGNRQQSNQYLLDGMNINQTLDDQPGYLPSMDAIGQVQIISANAPAEYGNVNGGDVIYQTKSGTNNWHGSAFFYLANHLLNANTWANKHNAVITPRSTFTRSIFGGTFGGPIIKDRLFFFGDYQGGRYHSGGVGTASVLTALERQGNFSELLDPQAMCHAAGPCDRLIQLYDAATPGSPIYAGNIIGSPVNPVAKYLFAHPELYPLPNQQAANIKGSPATSNYSGHFKDRGYGNQFDVKVDWKVRSADSLSVRFSFSNNGTTHLNVLPTQFSGAPTYPVRGVAINEIHTFNAAMVNEFRAGYTRIQNNSAVLLDPSGAFGLNGNKLLGINAPQPFAGFTEMAFGNSASPQSISATNGTEYSNLGNRNTGTNYTDNSFLYGDNFTWLKGKHTLKFGVQFLRQQQNNFYPGNDGSMGGFFYLGAGTASPNVDSAHTGYAVADFLLDRAGFASVGGVAGPVGMRSWRDAYFVQDDWKVLPNLTLNIGVRYEYDQPIYEVNHKMSTVDPDNPSVIIIDGSDTSVCNASGLPCVTAKSAGYHRGLVDPYYGGVMPRIGFAYSVTPRWVWRGGYGIQNFMEGTGANLRMTTNLPFQAAHQFNGSAASSAGPGSFFTVENGFSGNQAVTTSGGVFNIWNKKIKPAFIGEYSLTTEYQVSNTASFQIGYLGESGQHLVTANARNQLHAPCVINGVPQNPTSSSYPAQCLTLAPAPYADTPGLGYYGTVRYTDSNAMMNYNALQTTFRQRAWHGLQYTVNYTWSRAMTNSVGFYGVPSVTVQSAYAENVYNMHGEYGPAGQDVTHAINWNMVYDLPVGRGRMFGSNMPFIVDEVIGGWKIGMTGVSYTGFPVNISASNNSWVNGRAQRANHYRPLKVRNRDIDHWFGTDPSAVTCRTPGADNGVCAYGAPANGTFGNSPPTTERAPGYQNYGASVTKDFTIWHENQINFRADADNLFNSAYLGNPASNASNANFGQITSVRSGPRNLQLSVKYHF